MSRKSSIINSAVLLVSLGLASSLAVAEASKSERQSSIDIINSYKALRSTCAQSQGEERRNCYGRLNQATALYQMAKARIQQDQLQHPLLTQR